MDQSAKLIIKDVKIFTGHEWIEQGFVCVSDGSIVEVGAGAYKGDTAGHVVLSRPGDTLIPGLIDSHIHALGGNIQSIEQSIRFGVTTVCDMHNDPRDNAKLLDLVKNPQNYTKYSDFKCAGLGAVVEEGWPIPVMRKEFQHVPNGKCIAEELIATWPKLKVQADAAPYVEEQVKQNNASYIKMFHELGDSIGMPLPPPPMDVQKAVVQAAHDHNIIAVGHAFSHAGAKALLQAGVDGLTHIFFDRPPSDEFVTYMKSHGAHCSPTLGLAASQTGELGELQQRFLQDPFAQKMLLNKVAGRPVGFAISERPRSSFENACDNVKKLYAAGVPILVGTDAAGKELGTSYGLGEHMEMYLLSHMVGMSPTDVLRAATAAVAERFRFKDRGRIEEGLLADLVLLEGDAVGILGDKASLCLPIKGVWRQGVLTAQYEQFPKNC